jgi:hypothetical protein
VTNPCLEGVSVFMLAFEPKKLYKVYLNDRPSPNFVTLATDEEIKQIAEFYVHESPCESLKILDSEDFVCYWWRGWE